MSDTVTIVKAKTDTRRSKAYAKAGVALRQAHRDEFNKYYAAACVEAGMDYKPRKSKEVREAEAAEKQLAKAQAKVAALVAKHGEDVLPFEDTLPQ
jgi:CTP synthase (UTP-ammonia lyase)